MSPWKEFRHRIEAAACSALALGIPRLGRMNCVRLGSALGDAAYRLDARGRAVALANLECVFGDRYSLADRRDIARASYQNFARTMLDLFWASRLARDGYERHIRIEGFEALRAHIAAEKRGVVFLCVHQGNWEWASISGGFLGLHYAVVTEGFKNPRLTAIFNRQREITGQTMIPQDNSFVRMLKIVKRGGATGILIDLNLHPSQAATVIEGFGLKMCVPLLHGVLAQRGGARLVPVSTDPQPDGSCRVVVHPSVVFGVEKRLPEIAQQCWDIFDPVIRARPELWLWPYKHFRYRPKDAERAYPFYSNTSAKFEKLLRDTTGFDKSNEPPFHAAP